MKRALLVTAIALALGACSSTKLTNKAEDPGSMTPIYAQKLSSNFKRKGIKLEFDCGTVSSWTSGCNKADPTGIEVTAYAPSYGNSEVNREQAFRVAEMNAKAKLRKFIHEDVATSETKQVISKNIEKANDLPREIGNLKPGSKATIQVWRRGAARDVNVSIGEFAPENTASSERPKPSNAKGNALAQTWGLQVSALTPEQLRELKIKGGVHVDAATDAAARAGLDRKSTRLNSSHIPLSRMPSSA